MVQSTVDSVGLEGEDFPKPEYHGHNQTVEIYVNVLHGNMGLVCTHLATTPTLLILWAQRIGNTTEAIPGPIRR